MEIPTFNRFVDLAFNISLDGGDNLFGVAPLCFDEPKVIDYSYCLSQKTKLVLVLFAIAC